MKYDSINRLFVKSSSKSRILALVQSIECSLSRTCLVSILDMLDNEHFMDWTNAKILDFELDFTKSRFIESYFINQIPNTINDKQNIKFPSIYSANLLQIP